MDLADRVIDIDERDPITGIGARDQARHLLGQPGQEPPADSVELLHVPVGEGPQERAQRRGRTNPAEQPAHPAMAQQLEVIDAVGVGEHPAHHAGRLRRRVRRVDRQCLLKEVVQASGLAQPQRGNHPASGTTFGSSKVGRIV